jgi:hypothetical protein
MRTDEDFPEYYEIDIDRMSAAATKFINIADEMELNPIESAHSLLLAAVTYCGGEESLNDLENFLRYAYENSYIEDLN